MHAPKNNTRKRKRKSRRHPGRPAAGESLTRQDVAEAALQLVLAGGEEGLTMRRLGEALGVKAMALYNHFPDKEAILHTVAGLVLARIPVPPAKGSWKNRIKALCRGIRSFALEHPNLFRIAMTRPTPPANALPQIECVLSALAAAGLSPAAQSVAHQALRLYVRAYCLWEIEDLKRDGAPEELSRAQSLYPNLAAAFHLIYTPHTDRLFEAGLDLILRSLQAGTELPAAMRYALRD